MDGNGKGPRQDAQVTGGVRRTTGRVVEKGEFHEAFKAVALLRQMRWLVTVGALGSALSGVRVTADGGHHPTGNRPMRDPCGAHPGPGGGRGCRRPAGGSG
ncbi:hypothetical protein, partial [Streptomyces sp. NPDC091259]|uniref:hypothetical protein n=1 Tax=Streptomyces sp. NPDC091259 TaxID=3365976 RepID=UPI0038069E6C